MSFILDGLKKLEKKHPKGSVPNLSTIHEPLPEETCGRRIWPLLLSAVLLLNAVILIIWIVPWRTKNPEILERNISGPELETASADPVRKEPAMTPLTVISSTGTDNKQQTAPGHSPEKPVPVSEAAVPDISPASDPAEITKTAEPAEKEKNPEPASTPNADVTMEENPLPQDISESVPEKLPDIKITGHVYSDNPGLRMVVIDNRIRKEGDLVADDIKLLEITPAGAVLSYKGRRFSINGF